MATELPEPLAEDRTDLPAGQVEIGFKLREPVGTVAFEPKPLDDHLTFERRQIVEQVAISTYGKQVVVDLCSEVDRLTLVISERHGFHTPLSR